MKKVIMLLFTTFLCSGIAQGQSILMTTSNYESGNSAVYNTVDGIFTDKLLSVYQDSYAEAYGNEIFFIEAGNQSNIIKFDAANPSKPIYQYSVEAGSNPNDIVFYKSASYLKGYILRYDKPSIWVVNLDAASQNDFKKGEIDISQWADEDGSPEAHMGFLYNGFVYVVLQRYNLVKFQAENPFLIKIDPETDTILDLNPEQEGVNGIELINKNPSKGSLIGSVLYLGGTTYGAEDVGISSIDLANPMGSQKRITNESSLGGTFAGLYVFSQEYGVVTVYDANWDAVPYSYNPAQGTIGDKLPVSSAGGGAVMYGGFVYVGSSSFTSPGLYIVDPSTNKLVGQPKNTSLPVYSLAIIGENTNTAVKEEPVSAFSLENASPNPFNPRTAIIVNMAKTANIRADVYNISGQRVATICETHLSPGKHTFTWDASNFSTGLYLIRVSDGFSSGTVKASLIK